MRPLFVAIFAFASVALSAKSAAAHDLFLKPTQAYVATGETSTLQLLNGGVEESLNATPRAAMLDVTVLGPRPFHPDAGLWRDENETSLLTLRIDAAGSYAVSVSTRPSIYVMSPSEFLDYAREEGAEEIIRELLIRGLPTAPVRERYAKHARAILQVGDVQTRHFSQPLNYRLEIVPLTNPSRLNAGDTMRLVVLQNGTPLANARVHLGRSGMAGSPQARELITDSRGRASFPIEMAGRHFLSMVFMREVDDPDADFETDYATLNFEVR